MGAEGEGGHRKMVWHRKVLVCTGRYGFKQRNIRCQGRHTRAAVVSIIICRLPARHFVAVALDTLRNDMVSCTLLRFIELWPPAEKSAPHPSRPAFVIFRQLSRQYCRTLA